MSKATLIWEGEVRGKRARIVAVDEGEAQPTVCVEALMVDSMGGESWRPWHQRAETCETALLEYATLRGVQAKVRALAKAGDRLRGHVVTRAAGVNTNGELDSIAAYYAARDALASVLED